mmetsp:Transcript_3510/g.8943  ORF Transcript_3510/g.8943 Transcript_3510/m.8943 type:complete len:538 (+) Transcript_3510:115-1728(+)|eukprot:CAMPEP_0181110680 /NCGR_PEP_ID=MMETSP1071-20121207/18848_1 /TAXON_ID=35127 /ORGANISM="Thalassiosira sp., Strain NH16" /LENGTH=537 /DNA_ID=CAMNT_0023194477 /DNA_START=66 /DNA_END=1679 /DNA_ORIENTATION=+
MSSNMMDTTGSDNDDNDVPTHTEHKQDGNESYKAKDYRGALAHYTLAINAAKDEQQEDGGDDDDDPNTNNCDPETLASYYNNRAAAYTMILQYNEAVADCNEAIEIHPQSPKPYVRKAKAQISLGQLDEALASLNRCAIYDPNNATIISLKNDVQKLKDRLELARSLLGKTDSTRDFPPFPLPNVRDGKQALNQLTVVMASCSAWKSIQLERTQALLAVGRFEEAYAASTSLIRSNSHHHNNSQIILYRAYALQQMGNVDDAMKHLKQILSGDPDNKMAFAFHKLLKVLWKKKAEADAYYKSRDYKNAVEAYSEALLLTGCVGQYKARVLFNRACCNANLRNHADVVKDCTLAIRIDDEYIKAILRRAGSYLLMGEEADCQNAINDYQTVMNLAEKRGDEGKMREMKGKLREAQVQLKRSKQKDFYKILGVSRDATESEIKKSYRKSALKWHPDRHANSSEAEKTKAETSFRDINHAYEVLSDSNKKAKYDSGVDIEDLDNPHAGHGPRGHGGMGGHGGIDPNVLFEMFMRQQQGGF